MTGPTGADLGEYVIFLPLQTNHISFVGCSWLIRGLPGLHLQSLRKVPASLRFQISPAVSSNTLLNLQTWIISRYSLVPLHLQHLLSASTFFACICTQIIKRSELTPARIIGGDIIKIYVGPDEKLFKVHKDLLAQQSYFPYLFDREALSSRRLPPHPHILFDHYGNIFLLHDNPNAFSRLVEFLYRRTIPIIGRQPWRADPDEEVGLVMPLYLIAERLGLHLIMNRVIGEIQRLDQAGEFPSLSVDELEQIYENFEDGSKLWEYVMMGVASQLLWGLKDDEWAERFRELCYRNAEIGAEFFRISFQYGPELRTCQPAFFSASKYFYVGPIGCLSFPPLVPDFCGGSVEIPKEADASQAVVEDITAPRLKMEEDEEMGIF
jgi:hypothetical protein